MENAAGDILKELSKTSPYWVLAIITIWGLFFIWSKWGKQAVTCLDCDKLNFYKNEFDKNKEDVGKMANAVCAANDKLDIVIKKIDDNAREQKEFFERLIKKDDMQNEMLNEMSKAMAKLSGNIEIHSQMLINLLNKN
jgi:hypothetical protein